MDNQPPNQSPNPQNQNYQTENNQPAQPQTSFSAYQQMQYAQEGPKKRKLNSLMITLLIVVLLLVVVGVAMIVISGQKHPTVVIQDKSLTGSTENDSQTSTPADNTDQAGSSPNVSDATLVVQSFYDDLLSTLRTSSTKQYQERFNTYIKNNQNLTANYRTKLAKSKAKNTNPIMFDMTRLPSKLQYDDPVLSPKDDWIATQRVTLDFGSKESVALVTLKWTNSVTQAGFWQIDNITKAK